MAGAIKRSTRFGLVPALQATRPSLVTALKDTAAQGGGRRSRMRSGLVVAQIALSLVLLIGAGLVVRTLQQLQTMNPGFDPHNALTLSFDLGLQGYDQARGEQFYKHIVERVQSMPGVRSVAVTSYVPLSLNYNSSNIFVEGQPTERGANAPSAMVAAVGPKYFETMATQLVQGREFTDQDKEKSESVAMVNETFVRRLLPDAKSSADAIDATPADADVVTAMLSGAACSSWAYARRSCSVRSTHSPHSEPSASSVPR